MHPTFRLTAHGKLFILRHRGGRPLVRTVHSNLQKRKSLMKKKPAEKAAPKKKVILKVRKEESRKAPTGNIRSGFDTVQL